MIRSKTNRGFAYWEDKDSYGLEFSIQKSSATMEDKIWFGVNNVEPKVMSSDVLKNPELYSVLEYKKALEANRVGWVDYYIPDTVLLSSKIHINQEQAKDIIEVLQRFVDTGEV